MSITSRIGPGGMDAPRKPRTIGDLLDDRRFEILLMPAEVYRAHKAGPFTVVDSHQREQNEQNEEPDITIDAIPADQSDRPEERLSSQETCSSCGRPVIAIELGPEAAAAWLEEEEQERTSEDPPAA